MLINIQISSVKKNHHTTFLVAGFFVAFYTTFISMQKNRSECLTSGSVSVKNHSSHLCFRFFKTTKYYPAQQQQRIFS